MRHGAGSGPPAQAPRATVAPSGGAQRLAFAPLQVDVRRPARPAPPAGRPAKRQHVRKRADERAAVRTLLIDNYDSYTYNLFQLLAGVNGAEPTVVKNDELSWCELAARLARREYDNVVISPGPGTPTNPADAGVVNLLLQEAGDTPVLGVCFGMQALAHAHGAAVSAAPEPIHGRLSAVQHCGHALFAGIPSGFDVVRYHSLAVEERTLPDCLQPIAWTHAGSHAVHLGGERLPPQEQAAGGLQPGGRVLMGLAHARRPHWGVQFHPESVATQHGAALLRNFQAASAAHAAGRGLLLPADLLRQQQQQERRRREAQAFQVEAPQPEAQPSQQQQRPQPQQLDVRWRVLRGALGRLGGVEAVFWGLFGAEGDAADTFWLDSSAQHKQRFSYLGGRGGPLWRRLSFKLAPPPSEQQQQPPQPGTLTVLEASGESRQLRGGFLDHLDAQLAAFRCARAGADSPAESTGESAADADASSRGPLPFDFTGGFVGYLGYEMKAECGAPGRHASPHPDAAMFLADRLVVADHETGDVFCVAMHTRDAAGQAAAEAWLGGTQQQLAALQHAYPGGGEAAPAATPAASSSGSGGGQEGGAAAPDSSGGPPAWEEAVSPGGQLEARRSRAGYLADVAACLAALRAGDSYELCLTTQLRRRGAIDARRLYGLLRGSNPSAHAAWLRFGGGGPTVCCSSPERFLRGGADGSVEARPIKGTAARSANPVEDAARAAALRSCEKSRAENLMIVDLLRNDLGRVCQVGSVHVPRLMEVETYATVHNLVSTVRGQRRPGATAVDCIRAAFPGGSMTGAPKLRSMQILDRLENGPRGVYSGSLGFIGLNGTFDLNIVIRTAVVDDAGVTIGAGGAIVLQSDPASEYEEMRLKARALVSAVERAARAD